MYMYMYAYTHAMHIFMYSATSQLWTRLGNCTLAPTGQLRQQTTRFWNALEVYSSMGRVPESEVYRGA